MANGSSELEGEGLILSLADFVDRLSGRPAHGSRLHTPSVNAPVIGKIKQVMGSVTITRANVIAQPAVGDLVYEGDLIETGIDGRIAIVFVDGTTFRLYDSAHMVLDEFVFSAERSANSALFRVLKGRFSFLSGLLATTGRLMIDTAVARIQNTRPAAGIGGLAFSVFTIGLIHELNAASADIALLDDGTITCKDLKHGVFEIVTKGDHPQRFIVDDPCVSIHFQIVGSQVRVSEVANTPGQMAAFHDAFLSTLDSFLRGQQDSLIQKWEHAELQSTSHIGSSTQPGMPTGLASILSEGGMTVIVSGTGAGGTTSGSSSTSAIVNIPLNVIWDSTSGTWPSTTGWDDGAPPLPIQNVIIDYNGNPTKVTFDTTASILGLTIQAGAILNIVGGSLTVTETINNAGLIEINSSGVDPTLAISGNILLDDGGAIWLRPPPSPNPAANMIIGVGASTLTNVNNTIFGSGTIGTGDGALTLVNDAAGTIDALGGTLILDTGHTIDNSGILAAGLVTAVTTALTGTATGSGTLQINDVGDNAGLIEAAANGILDIKTDLITWTGGTAIAGTNGILLELGGTLEVDVAKLQLTGGGAVSLAGGAITGAASTDILDNVDNTISGYGTIGGGGLQIVNTNLIEATNDGTLVLSGTTVTNFVGGTNGTVHADSGSTVELDAATIHGGNVTIAGALDSLGSSFIDDGAAITGAGTVTVSGGTLTLSNTGNTYSGATTINGGSTLSGGATDAFSNNSAVTDNGTLDLQGYSENIASLTSTGTDGTVTNLTDPGAGTPAILTIDGGANTTFGGTIVDGAGTVGLTLSNDSALTLTNIGNTYSGATTINSGTTLAAGAADAFSANSAVTDNGMLDLGTDDQAIKALNGTNTSALVGNFSGSAAGPAVLTISNGGAYAGVIEDGTVSSVETALILTGGTLTLSGDNTYTGATTVSAGTLQAGSATAFASGSAYTVDGTLDLDGFSNTIGSLAGSGTVEDSSATAVTLTAGGNNTSTTFSGDIINDVGVLSLTKTGTGTLILSGANTYTGTTTVDGGTLSVTTGGASGDNLSSGAVTLENDAILLANGSGDTISNAITLGSGGGTINVADSASDTFSGVIGGSADLTVNSDTTGTLILSGANTYTGTTTVDGGTLQIGSGDTSGSIAGAVTDNGTLAFDLSTTYTFSGVISGSGAVNQIGSGTTILTGDDTYTGATTVSAGTLELSETGSIADSSGVTIDNGATLDLSSITSTSFSPTISFAGATGTGTVDIASTASTYSLTILGSSWADSTEILDFTGLTYNTSDTLTYTSTDVWTLRTPGGDTVTINVTGGLPTYNSILVVEDAHGGTKIVIATEDEWIKPKSGNGNGQWTLAAGWSEGVPTSTENAVIDLAGTYTVTLSGGTETANSLTISDPNATLSGSGTLEITTIDNSGTIEAGLFETLVLEPGAGPGLSPSITNSGLLAANGLGAVLLIEDTAIDNTGGTIEATGSLLGLFAALVELDNVTIAGGTVETGTANTIETVTSGSASAFDDVIVASGSNVAISNGTTLTFAAGTIMTDGTLSIGSSGTLDIESSAGATLNGVHVTNDHTIAVGSTAAATLTLEGSATVTGGTLSLGASSGVVDVIGSAGATFSGVNVSNGDAIHIGTSGTSGSASELQIVGTVTLNGSGSVVLENSGDQILGVLGTLDNVSNTISGAGAIGDLLQPVTLVNGGVINADDPGNELTIYGGLSTVTNTGTLEATNGGELVVDTGVNNAHGTIVAGLGSTVDIAASITSGSATIDGGGTLIFGASSRVATAFDNNGTGNSTYGKLVLDDPLQFSGAISGFTGTAAAGTTPNLGNTDEIDLAGINPNEVHFSESNGNAEIAIKFLGITLATITIDNFNSSNLRDESDGHGGTIVYDPPANPPTSSVSISNDNFIFHPSLGSDTGNVPASGYDAELDRLSSAQVQHWAPLICSYVHEDAIDFVHHGDGITPPDPSAAQWHFALHNAVNLH